MLALVAYSGVTSARVSLSLYALDLGAQSAQVGLLMGTYYVFPLLLAWPIGRMADRIGSRVPLMLGLTAGILGLLLPWAVPHLYSLYVAGLLLGFSFTFATVLIQNMTGLLSKPEERTRNFANASLIGAGSNILGPLIAGFAIDHAGHGVATLCSPALFVAAILILALLGSAWPGPSGRSADAAGNSLRGRLSDRQSFEVIVVSCVVQLGTDMFALYIPIYGHGIGLSASTIGGVLASYYVAVCLVRFSLPVLVRKWGESRLLANAQFTAAAAFFLLPLFENPFMLGLVSFLFGLGMGCSQPITMVLLMARAPEGRTGETVALRQTANNVVRLIGPPTFGAIGAFTGIWGVFMLNALVMAVGGWTSLKKGVTTKA